MDDVMNNMLGCILFVSIFDRRLYGVIGWNPLANVKV
jgi:hypothetical protein